MHARPSRLFQLLYWSAANCKKRSVLYHFRVFWRWIILWPWKWTKDHSRCWKGYHSSLDTISYSQKQLWTSLVSLQRYSKILVNIAIFPLPLHSTPPFGGQHRNTAISFSTEKLVDRPYTTFYWSAIVSIALTLLPFQVIWRWIISWAWSLDFAVIQGHLKVVWKLGCDFLFALRSNYGSISYHFRDKTSC